MCRAATPFAVIDARSHLSTCAGDTTSVAADLRALDVAWAGPAAQAYGDAITDACSLLDVVPPAVEDALRLLDAFSVQAEEDATAQALAQAATGLGS